MGPRLTGFQVEGYRSIRKLRLPVGHLSVLVGRNGVGKTNLYRALELTAAAARGTITREIAGEGGIESVLWAGPRQRGKPVRLKFGAELGDLTYTVEIGLPTKTEAAISLTEPLVKEEELVFTAGRPVTLMKRRGPSVWLRDGEGKRHAFEHTLLASETALATFQDAAMFAELDAVRRALADWRFFHNFRTDAGSPIRRPPLAVTTPTLASDGSDMAAALVTRMVIDERVEIDAAIADAFPGASLDVAVEGGRVMLSMTIPDMPRPLAATEVSDGTLAYLCLVAALASYRLPGFIALNEPETSLHPDLIRPLARLIGRAAERTPVWCVTHAPDLADALEVEAGARPWVVCKQDGATWLEGLKLTGEFADDDEEG